MYNSLINLLYIVKQNQRFQFFYILIYCTQSQLSMCSVETTIKTFISFTATNNCLLYNRFKSGL